MTTLEAITRPDEAAPIELPRLPVANTFITYNSLLLALRNAGEAASKVPESSSLQATADALKDVVRYCEGAIKHAQRLLEANR